MRTPLKAIISILLACISIPVIAQQHIAKTLLWRISGNGLQKPSYLFGTMHLTDKRLFNFTDSVYKAIETSDGLAIEVNPDEMIAYFINKTFDELQKGKKIKDMLDNKEYKTYSSSLEKKFGKPADEITTHDVVKEKNKWMTEYLEKGEMPTFVDGYLYTAAKKQGKWIGGIEDIADQADLMDNMVDKTDITYLLADKGSGAGTGTDKIPAAVDNSVEKMISAYTSQDVDEIERLSTLSKTDDQKDMVLTRRNIKMARRIDSLSALRTMFFAVGAAHLPGDSGVIQLLRARGFTVEPVISNKKIAAADYKFKEIDIPWVEVKDDQGMYKALMPGNPVPLKLYGLIDMKFMFDIGNFTGFYTMAIPAARKAANEDSVYSAFVERMFKGQKVSAAKQIENNGTRGREYTTTLEGMAVRVQLFLGDNAVYVVMAYSLKKESMASAGANKFFSNFSINKDYALPSAEASVFTDSLMGISFNTPVKLELNKQLTQKTANGLNLTVFSGIDLSTGNYIMLFSKDVMPGMYITNDSILQSEFKILLNKQQYVNLQFKDTVIQGRQTSIVEGDNQKQKLHLRAVNTVFGNRSVNLFVLGTAEAMATPQINGIFTSFKILPRPQANWQQYTAANANFSAWAPSPIREYTTESQTIQYIAFDTTTATTYFVVTDTLGKYEWADSDSSFWQSQVKSFTVKDSVINETNAKNGGLYGKDVLIKKSGSYDTYKRMRLLADGNIVYKLIINGSRTEVMSDNTDKFFTSFAILTPLKENFISKPKTGMLLNDLLSSDSATLHGAYEALYDAPFTHEDLPALHDALFKKYAPLYDSAEETIVNQRIARCIENVGSNTSVDFIKEKYTTLNGANSKFKPVVLSILAGIHTRSSYDVLVNLLQQSVPESGFIYTFEGNLKDSLALTAGIYPALLPFVKDSAFTLTLANITVALLDSGLINAETLAPYQNDFIGFALKVLPTVKKQQHNDIDYDMYNLIELLGKLNTPGSYAALKSYLEIKDITLLNDVVNELLKHEQAVPAATLKTIASEAAGRMTLYNNLKELKKTSLFPAEYLTQQYFAQSDVYASAEDDEEDGNVKGVTFLMKKNATYKDTSYTFYLYKVVIGEGEDAAVHLGVAGGYKPGSTALEPAKYVTSLYWKEDFDAKKINEQFNAFIAGLDAEEGEGDDDGEND